MKGQSHLGSWMLAKGERVSLQSFPPCRPVTRTHGARQSAHGRFKRKFALRPCWACSTAKISSGEKSPLIVWRPSGEDFPFPAAS